LPRPHATLPCSSPSLTLTTAQSPETSIAAALSSGAAARYHRRPACLATRLLLLPLLPHSSPSSNPPCSCDFLVQGPSPPLYPRRRRPPCSRSPQCPRRVRFSCGPPRTRGWGEIEVGAARHIRRVASIYLIQELCRRSIFCSPEEMTCFGKRNCCILT
jgi:hypothetical protein